ncbi:NRAMP family divalent metal transporter [Pseudoalteromonas sp. SSDWG2]|uniref:NRAMP family divalent metal transporter n=1 Tax=Pseudoalteromonas sp. SSDWG2 TaxID=3139391 RepID=UPI003BA8AD6C
MATAAIGGSHLVAATQAGALYGWQLAWLVIAVNVCKYPFFRCGVEYTLATGESLVAGYKQQGPGYFYSFVVLSLIAAVVNTAGVLLLSAALLHYIIGGKLGLTALCLIILTACLLLLLLGHYRALDRASKWIMAVLALSTLSAFFIAVLQHNSDPILALNNHVSPDIFTLAGLSFVIVMMGWMPAPIEISVLNSLWLKAKQKQMHISAKAGLFDFNLGYVMTAILALVFFALGVLIQHGQSANIELAGVAFAKQLIDMYAHTIGEWSRWLIALVAFLCMLGTTLTVLDGYARSLTASAKLIKSTVLPDKLSTWLLIQASVGMAVILFFKSNLKDMLTFAMTLAFLTTPVFAWLNMRLVRQAHIARPLWLKVLTWVGLIYLISFSVAFVVLQLW